MCPIICCGTSNTPTGNLRSFRVSLGPPGSLINPLLHGVGSYKPLQGGEDRGRLTDAIYPLAPFHHFTLSAHQAADILPLDMFFACRALKEERRAFCESELGFLPAPLTPCWPNLIVLVFVPSLATTTWDFVGWFGVRFGLLYPLTPAALSFGSRPEPPALPAMLTKKSS